MKENSKLCVLHFLDQTPVNQRDVYFILILGQIRLYKFYRHFGVIVFDCPFFFKLFFQSNLINVQSSRVSVYIRVDVMVSSQLRELPRDFFSHVILASIQQTQ